MNELFRIKDALERLVNFVNMTDNEFTNDAISELCEANNALNDLVNKLLYGNPKN